jgi:fatty-acyl-CoA synthase
LSTGGPNDFSVGALARLGAQRSPRRPVLKDAAGRTLTYAEFDRRTDRLANALIGLGLDRGDRVAAWLSDRMEYVELYLAIAKAGLVMVPVNAKLRSAEAMHPLRDSGARALFFSSGIAGSVEELTELDGVTVVAVGDDAEGPADHRFEDLVESGAEGTPPSPDPDSPYVIGYTSGTTGLPKGAVLTHRAVLAIARLNSISYRLPLGSTCAATGSMSFVATVPAHYLSHLLVGGTVLILGRWDSESLIATVESERATFTYLPSPTIGDFTELASRDPRRWSSLESILHSASRAEPSKLRGLCEVVGDRFVEGLGMTENSGGLITATTRADISGEPETKDVYASVGRAVAESAVKVLDDEGNPIAADGEAVGEMVIRSPALFSGYWNRPRATVEVLVDGWYHTGDLGSIDANGYLYIAERRTDLIVSGGINVYPSEIEDFIKTIPGVADCAVVGLPHERWGQTVVAAITSAPGQEVTEKEVVERCRASLAAYKKPTAVVILDELPRTVSLKVRRSEVRETLTARLAK